MAELLENVVAENRRLRHELKSLEARAHAIEASRWWRLHPRFVLRRFRSFEALDPRKPTPTSKIARLGRQWRLRAQHEERNTGCGPDEIVIRDGILLKIHPKSRATFDVYCYWSPEGVDELDSFIANTVDCRRLLDVGASHGVFSLVFAAGDPTKGVLAVEASPLAFSTLLYNVHKNGARNVTARECALSDGCGELEMRYYGEYVVADGGVDADPPIRIESTTGDGLCASHSFEPDVVKIDVEGHEIHVLQGLHETIDQSRPLIFLEVHPAMMQGRMSDLVALLQELRYGTAELRGKSVPVETLERVDEVERILLRPDSG